MPKRFLVEIDETAEEEMLRGTKAMCGYQGELDATFLLRVLEDFVYPLPDARFDEFMEGITVIQLPEGGEEQ